MCVKSKVEELPNQGSQNRMMSCCVCSSGRENNFPFTRGERVGLCSSVRTGNVQNIMANYVALHVIRIIWVSQIIYLFPVTLKAKERLYWLLHFPVCKFSLVGMYYSYTLRWTGLQKKQKKKTFFYRFYLRSWRTDTMLEDLVRKKPQQPIHSGGISATFKGGNSTSNTHSPCSAPLSSWSEVGCWMSSQNKHNLRNKRKRKRRKKRKKHDNRHFRVTQQHGASPFGHRDCLINKCASDTSTKCELNLIRLISYTESPHCSRGGRLNETLMR